MVSFLSLPQTHTTYATNNRSAKAHDFCIRQHWTGKDPGPGAVSCEADSVFDRVRVGHVETTMFKFHRTHTSFFPDTARSTRSPAILIRQSNNWSSCRSKSPMSEGRAGVRIPVSTLPDSRYTRSERVYNNLLHAPTDDPYSKIPNKCNRKRKSWYCRLFA